MANGEWRMANGEWRMQHATCTMQVKLSCGCGVCVWCVVRRSLSHFPLAIEHPAPLSLSSSYPYNLPQSQSQSHIRAHKRATRHYESVSTVPLATRHLWRL
jgi:hypothetical protein